MGQSFAIHTQIILNRLVYQCYVQGCDRIDRNFLFFFEHYWYIVDRLKLQSQTLLPVPLDKEKTKKILTKVLELVKSMVARDSWQKTSQLYEWKDLEQPVTRVEIKYYPKFSYILKRV